MHPSAFLWPCRFSGCGLRSQHQGKVQAVFGDPHTAQKEAQAEGRELMGHGGSLTSTLWALSVNTAVL